MAVPVLEPRHQRSRRAHDRYADETPDVYSLKLARRRAAFAVGSATVETLERVGLTLVDRDILQRLVDGVGHLPEALVLAEYVIAPGMFMLKRHGREISLTPTEWRILLAILEARGHLLPHKRLLELAWGEAYRDEPHLLRVNIARMRAKLEPETHAVRSAAMRLRSNAERQAALAVAPPYRLICTHIGVGYYCGLLREIGGQA